jgi:thiamine pyrophosphate-dependent acetolactate synthase large subunit-like protein
LCLLGDQGFTNAVAAIGELGVPLVILVCNNGSSVSLRTQAASDGLELGDLDAMLLGNSNRMNYTAIAAGYGIAAHSICWPDRDEGAETLATAARQALSALTDALAAGRPCLLELVTTDAPDFWEGVWRTAGYEAG